MKDLDPAVFVSVFQEMLGPLFWPLVAFIALAAAALVAVLLADRRISPRRLVLSEIVGLAGGFVAVWFMLWITNSQLADVLGGPVDWLLTAGIWVAGALGATIVAYVGFALLERLGGAPARSGAIR